MYQSETQRIIKQIENAENSYTQSKRLANLISIIIAIIFFIVISGYILNQ